MKAIGWICWLLVACVCLSEARYKIRRPPPPQPPPTLYKKSWPIGHRMSMGNTIHIGGNYGHKRPHHKPANYRIRRPPMYNVMPNTWKSQVPVLGAINNHAALPQRPPVKEFHSMNKVPEYSPEYRPETAVMPPTHRGGMDDDKGAIHTIPAPNLSLADKPYNLVEGNAPENNPENQGSRNHYPNDGPYNGNLPATNFGFGTLVTSVAPQRTATSPAPTQIQYDVTETNEIGSRDYHTAQPTFYTPEFDVTRLATPPNLDLQSNELYLNHPLSVNGLKPGTIGANIQFGQSNAPMQTNLHSSLHVGFPGSASQSPSSLGQQIPDLHVGHPVPAAPPLSATQLYDLLNSFPQQVSDQYASGQQPQLQQHILQHQLGQLFQPTGGADGFPQPQMHSFNYDEQANKLLLQQQQLQQQQQQQQQQQRQQQIIVGQDYGSGRVTADYNLEPEEAGNAPSPSQRVTGINGNNVNNEEVAYRGAEPSDQAENHIEYEESSNQRGQNTYFSKVGGEGSVSTQFYTTLPNKDAAEKLAALAAAGNVNSHLIGQLRKQQQRQQEQQQQQHEQHHQQQQQQQRQHHQQQQPHDQQDTQGDEPVPSNHKDGSYEVNESQDDDVSYESQQQQYNDQQQEHYDEQQERYDEQQQQYDQQQYNRQHYIQQQQIRQQQQELSDRYEQQRFDYQQQQMQGDQPEASTRRPIRIMVPDHEEYPEGESKRTSTRIENTSEDYDYDNPEPETATQRTTASSDSRTTYEQNPNSEFGTRLAPKKGQ